jgi:hypothetical protein
VAERSTRGTGVVTPLTLTPAQIWRIWAGCGASRCFLLAFQTPGGLPLAAPFRGGSVGARHPTFRTKAAGQARATSAPGTTWPAIRATARLIPGQAVTPGSDATFLNNDAINGESLAGLLMQRLPGPHLTHHVRLFPRRSPRRSSANAAESGLKPPPEGWLREADNLSSLVQHRFQPPIASGSLQRSWHTGF